MHIDNPQLTAVMVVGSTHLVIDESWLGGGEPNIVMRTSPVREVIIDASPTLAFLLFFIREACHIAVVVVTPHQRDIIRYLQTNLQNLEHLLIRNKDLGHLLHLFMIILANQFTLVVNDLLQAFQLFLLRFHALHRTVVDATHADSKKLLRAFHLLQALYPVLLHLLTVGDIVVRTTLSVIPLGYVVAQQGFAVRGTDDNTTRVGHLFVARNSEEPWRARMHSRPNSISTQTEHQLEDGLVGLRAHSTELTDGLIMFPRPVAQAPVLIVDEDATIGHRRSMFNLYRLVKNKTHTLFRNHIAPPHPRRDASHTRQFQQTIGRTTGIMALNDYLTVLHAQAEAIVRTLTLHDADGSRFRCHGFHARNLLHIATEHLEGNLHHRVHLAHHLVTDGMLSIKPHHISSSQTTAYSQEN